MQAHFADWFHFVLSPSSSSPPPPMCENLLRLVFQRRRSSWHQRSGRRRRRRRQQIPSARERERENFRAKCFSVSAPPPSFSMSKVSSLFPFFFFLPSNICSKGGRGRKKLWKKRRKRRRVPKKGGMGFGVGSQSSIGDKKKREKIGS